ncbi:MAG: Do family serine endopeptidase [Cytophagaceae bacterium]|jgi:Do/DeqQ family serine protease|nr:Do family serine endopeptidase [Cytophagaceae bacterium]
MNTRKIVITFIVAVMGAIVGVFAYSKIVRPNTQIVEVPVNGNSSAQYTALPTSLQGGVDLTFAAEKSIHTVVHVQTKGRTSASSYNPLLDFFFGPGSGYRQESRPVMGSGSGVIITKDGFIVTNNHVVANADEIEVVLNDRRTFRAVKVGTDPTTDIALLKIEASDLPFLSYGNSDQLKIGEWVLAVGNPLNLNTTVTAGIVSAKSRSIQISGDQMGIEAFIQTDAAVNPGNSGGALVNTQGELVGINTVIASNTGAFIGYSFAVPVSIVQKVVSDLMEFGEVQRGLIGVGLREMDSELAKELNFDKIKGVYVAEVYDGGAKEAGIEKGDVIISVNGDPVNAVPELQERVSRHRPGEKIEIIAIRNGKNKPFTVTLRNTLGNTDVMQTASILSSLGAKFETVSDAERQAFRLRNGLKIISISNGKLKDAGIKEGYIISKANRVPINSEDDLRKVIEVADEGLFLTGIYPNGRVAYYAVNMHD